MKLGTLFALTRPRQIAFLLIVNVIWATIWSLTPETWSALSSDPVQAISLLLLPFFSAQQANRLILAPLQRPGALLWPGVGRRIARSHAGWTALIALLFATIAHFAGGTLPWPLGAVVAFGAMTLALPNERSMVWLGSRTLGMLVQVILLPAAYFAGRWLPWIGQHPLLATLAILGWSVLLYSGALGPAARRRRAWTHEAAGLPLAELRGDRRQWDRVMARRVKRVHWRRRLATGSLCATMRGLTFEHFRGDRTALRAALQFAGVSSIVLVGVALLLAWANPSPETWRVLRELAVIAVWGDTALPFPAIFVAMGISFALLFSVQLAPIQVRRTRFPDSRTQLAESVVRVTWLALAEWFGALLLLLAIAAGLTAQLIGLSDSAPAWPAPLASLLVALPISCACLINRFLVVRWPHLVLRGFILFVTALLWFSPILAAFFAPAILTPLGVLSCGLATVVFAALHRWLLRWHYRTADLIAHQIGLSLEAA